MKLLLFTIVLISCTCIRLKSTKSNLWYLDAFLKYCCKYKGYFLTRNYYIKGDIGNFYCDASQFNGMYCYCDENCVYGTCKNSTCIGQELHKDCITHMDCSPYQSLFCLNFTCRNFSGT